MHRMTSKHIIFGITALVILIGGVFVLTSKQPVSVPQSSSGRVLQIVAAENFWGSLISQLGGTHVHVLSIVSDPNADPHEYESNTTDARAVADADYVIVNGAGYDSWMNKLLSAGGNSARKTLEVSDLLGKKEGDNPHFWYNPTYVNQVIAQMDQDLIAADPTDGAYYQQQYATLQTALAPYQNQIAAIKQEYAATPVGATEDIFMYFALATGLDLTTPPEFIQAVGEGNDPTAASVVEFQNQINTKQIKVLVYNEQTVTPITETIKALATAQGIPIVGITETTVPPDAPFQDWMSAEVIALQQALQSSTGGK